MVNVSNTKSPINHEESGILEKLENICNPNSTDYQMAEGRTSFETKRC